MPKNFQAGRAIRELRRQQNITGQELAKKTGISQPRISKIETGADTNPNRSDVDAILNALDAPQVLRQQIMTALGKPETVRLYRYRARYLFEDAYDQERKSKLVRVFTTNIVPALLQTVEFRQGLLERWDSLGEVKKLAMVSVLKRQDLLWGKTRYYHFVMHEAALYTAPAGPAVQLAQLDRIERFVDAKHIKVGIIALQAGLSLGTDNGAFVIRDDDNVGVAMTGTTIRLSKPEDVNEYLKVFTELDKLADYGDSARALIHKAMEYFS